MDVLIIMCLGILAGRFLLSPRIKKMSETISVVCTFLLIFSMGVMLGRKETFFEELSELGITSFLFFFIPTLLSIVLVYCLTQIFMKKRKKTSAEGSQKH